MNNAFKKTVISGLTLAMLAGGASAAFADGRGKDKDRDKDRDKDLKVIQTQWNNKEANVNLNIRLTFDDLKGKDVEWAQRYIASLASKRVFEGYEDGTFKPRQTISRIEAITAAVRLMGLRDQAESADAKASNLNFKDADKIKQKYPWAVGYVAVALQNDLFTENDDAVQPEKEADRLWATTLLVKALKLQDEAKSKMNAKAPFADADKIPAGSVGYVAVALEHKLIDGYDDNTFRPNKPVTRAELAALLDRTGTQVAGPNLR
ncbi:S-layer homology domain-containing protein [Paenibacillus sp. P26]|nr:S-layer homology domain-containing protein [Paenibacillus sp. P26]